MTLNTNFNLTSTLATSWSFQNALAIQTVNDSGNLQAALKLAQGIASGQANEFFADERVITAGSPTTSLNLYGGLVDVFGQTINFQTIKFLLVVNNGTPVAGSFALHSDAVLLVGGGGAGGHAWGQLFNGDQSAQMPVGAGDFLVLTNQLNGLALTPGSSDTLKFTHSGSEDISFSVLLAGVM